MISQERDLKLKDLARNRQRDLTIILENVHDPHNIGAVMRTADAVGIQDIHIIYTKESQNSIKQYVGQRASRGTKKWVNSHFYASIQECMEVVKPNFKHIYATHLGQNSKSIYDCDFTEPTALVFGNERQGVSEELLAHCTGNVLIPMVGMVQSLNISVAVAVTIYEAYRQRSSSGCYSQRFDFEDPFMQNIYREGVFTTYPRIYETDPEKLDEIVREYGNQKDIQL